MNDGIAISVNGRDLRHAIGFEMERCRGLLAEYNAIGPAGMFGAGCIEQSLDRATRAVAADEPVLLLKAYQDLRRRE